MPTPPEGPSWIEIRRCRRTAEAPLSETIEPTPVLSPAVVSPPSSDPSIERLLARVAEGESDAVDELFERVYDDLRSLARVLHRSEGGVTLNTTALVHEAYFKLNPGNVRADSELHFKRIVGRAMRQVLVDAARARSARKRGGADAVRVTLDEQLGRLDGDGIEYIQLERALEELEAMDPRCAKVVECRFFAGMDVPETARALGVSEPTVKRDWRVARAWLAKSLEP